MALRLRVYQKKRGHRRTGSRKLGFFGEALFFASFFVLGCVGLVLLFVTLVWPEWRASNEFVEHKCVVRDKRIGQTETDSGTLYRPEILIEYQVNGQNYCRWIYDVRHQYSSGRSDRQAILNRFFIDGEYPCWYDPADPKSAVLVRGCDWWVWLTFMVPISFIVIGGGGFIYRILSLATSAERRAAIAQRAARLDLFDTGRQSSAEYPYVPDGSYITESPGTKLAFRLPIGSSPAWCLFYLGLGCVFWNTIVSVFVVIAVNGHLEGHPDWWLTICIIPFVLVGIGLIVYFIRQALIANGIGPTLVEISHHPLLPGARYAMFLSQSGRLRINSLEVLLVCEEEATYRQGTDTRTETRRVYQQQVFRRQQFEIHRGMPFEIQCDLEIPAGAMHSFKADHNEVSWKLLVKGDVASWPNYQRGFPVIVCPSNGRAEA